MKDRAYVFCFVVIDTCNKFDTKDVYAANTQKGRGEGLIFYVRGAGLRPCGACALWECRHRDGEESSTGG